MKLLRIHKLGDQKHQHLGTIAFHGNEIHLIKGSPEAAHVAAGVLNRHSNLSGEPLHALHRYFDTHSSRFKSEIVVHDGESVKKHLAMLSREYGGHLPPFEVLAKTEPEIACVPELQELYAHLGSPFNAGDWLYKAAEGEMDLRKEEGEPKPHPLQYIPPKTRTNWWLNYKPPEPNSAATKSYSDETHFTDGTVRIPKSGHPDRANYDARWMAALQSMFQAQDKVLVPTKVDLTTASNANNVHNQERYNMYRHMVRSGETLQPVVVRRTPNGSHHIVDGNHRSLAAKAEGLKEMDGLEMVDVPVRYTKIGQEPMGKSMAKASGQRLRKSSGPQKGDVYLGETGKQYIYFGMEEGKHVLYRSDNNGRYADNEPIRISQPKLDSFKLVGSTLTHRNVEVKTNQAKGLKD